MADIPHPFIAETLQQLGALPAGLRAKVVFTHLNHSNPAANPLSVAAADILKAGMAVAAQAQVFPL